MDDLRAKCPWDMKQTIDSLRILTIEETYELADAITSKDMSSISEELGDLLFSVVNISRYLKIDPEQALRRANQKFEQRFNYIETRAVAPLAETSIEEMNALWDQAKKTIHD